MGTATTIGVYLRRAGITRAGCCCRGCNVSLEALSRRAAQLPAISLQHPKVFIGKNDGGLYALRHRLRHRRDAGRGHRPHPGAVLQDETLSVVATGGNAPVIVRYCRNKIVYDKYLLMDGLWDDLSEE